MKRSVVVLGALLIAGTARGSADNFGVGNQHSGDLDLSACSSTVYINEYTTLTNISVDGLTLSVQSSANFANGDLVLVWQPAAMAPGSVPSGSQTEFPFTGTTGRFELARVSSKPTSASLLLTSPMNNRTFSPNLTQVVKVPEFR